MGSIKLLSPDLCNQIAAGEVVERPASVLKELVENSLDAGATQIDARLDNGGQTLIRVQDNGSGIPAAELELAVKRHATSKIATSEDLDRICTLGFRGEALPSIASVSRFRISSVHAADGRPAGIGASLFLDHGKKVSLKETALPCGTVVEVQDLFANVPGRLKFLKQPATEFRKARDWLLRLAIARPQIGFSLWAGDREACRFARNQSLRARMAQIWPTEIVDELLPIEATLHGIAITGLAAPPSLCQPKPDRIYFYVNGRAVNDKRLLSAVKEAYRGRITTRDYPQLVLFLEINPAEVDVNAHPAKTEVRFQNESALFSAIFGALGRAFQTARPEAADLSPEAFLQPRGFWGSLDRPRIMETPRSQESSGTWTVVEESTSPPSSLQESFPISPPSSPLPAPAPQPVASHEYLGQIADTYLVLRKDNALVLLDQHAAHERVLHCSFLRGSMAGGGQKLILPIDIGLEDGWKEKLADVGTELRNLGFRFRVEERVLHLDAISPLLTRAESRDFIREVLSGKNPQSLPASLACHSAIKAGQKLSNDEALELIHQWEETPERDFCPHGRPCVLRFDGSALERMFKRR